jgi:cytochrome P450
MRRAPARDCTPSQRRRSFPLGAQLTVAQLSAEPHAHLARLRAEEPVSWVPALDAWLVTRHDLAVAVLRDPRSFTVEHPGFSTAQVVGPSMLSLDGAGHARNRAPFVGGLRPQAVQERFQVLIDAEVAELLDGLTQADGAELRRQFAGPLAARVLAAVLGLKAERAPELISIYERIVGAVEAISGGQRAGESSRSAFAALKETLRTVLEGDRGWSLLREAAASGLPRPALLSNAAVLLFGGIETTEGMIANAVLALLSRPRSLAQVQGRPELVAAALEESLRLEPAAAAVDRYAVAPIELAGATIRRGELVRVSLSAANRDPQVFPHPDRFDLARAANRRHLAFAQGPHVCLGVHLARLEARVALGALLGRLPSLRLHPGHRPAVRGLIFRKPPALHVLWSEPRGGGDPDSQGPCPAVG